MNDGGFDQTGGPAFPSACTNNSEDVRFGMTLRDYFAGQALGASDQDRFREVTSDSDVARCCYELADAMIIEREKKKTV